MPNILKLLPLITKYARYIPILIALIQGAESIFSGAKRGADKKAAVITALKALVETAAAIGVIPDEDAAALVDGLVAMLKAFGDMPKPGSDLLG